jgi:hypothetical protein
MVNSRVRIRPAFVPELGLELVPDLRQLPVRVQLKRQGGEDFLVRHAKGEVGPLAVAQPEHLLAHDLPPAAALPDLGRVQARQQELLGADPLHLLADDLDDLRPDPDTERQERVVAGHQLPDETRSEQKTVARSVGLRWIFTQRRDVHL